MTIKKAVGNSSDEMALSTTKDETGYKIMNDEGKHGLANNKSPEAPVVVTLLFWDEPPRCGFLPNRDRQTFPQPVRGCPMISSTPPAELMDRVTKTEWTDFYKIINGTIQWNKRMRLGFLLTFLTIYVLSSWYFWDVILSTDMHVVKLVALLIFLVFFVPFACWLCAETQKRHQYAVDHAADMFERAGYEIVYQPVSTPLGPTAVGYVQLHRNPAITRPGSAPNEEVV